MSSRYSQGNYSVQNPEKFVGQKQPFARSSWEMAFMRFCDSHPNITKWASENVILLELDFPRRKKLDPNLEATNNELQNIFKVRGFPTVWLFSVTKTEDEKFTINANLSNPFQKMGYMGSAKDFISKANYIIEKMNEIY